MTERIPFPEHAWPLLRRALEHIAAHPGEFWMGAFLLDFAESDSVDIECWAREHPAMKAPACGTVACLAGRICLEAGAFEFNSFAAFDALGLSRFSARDGSVRAAALDEADAEREQAEDARWYGGAS